MSSTFDDAREVRGYLKEIIKEVLHSDPDFRSTWQLRRAIVVSAPNGGVCSVALTGDRNADGTQHVITLPYSSAASGITIGDYVLVGMIGGNLSNAIVWEKYNFS